MKKAIIIDLDGTLCDCEHRRKFKEGSNKIDFGHFLDPENVAKDPLNNWCRELIYGMDKLEYNILFVSGNSSLCLLYRRSVP